MSELFSQSIPGQRYAVNTLRDLSPQALGEIRAFLETSGFALPISQIVGFQQFTAKSDVDNGAATIASATYGDPATGDAGPSLSGLPDGSYVVLYGALAWDSSGGGGTTYMSLKVNGTEATDADAVSTTANANGISVMRTVVKTLSNAGDSTLTLRYKMSVGTGRWDNRFLIALRYANA
jgi:hypothetical protein